MIDVLAKSEPAIAVVSAKEYLDTDIEWHQYPIKDGRAGFSSLKLHDGIVLHHSLIEFASDASTGQDGHVDFCRARIDFAGPVLVIHCCLAGKVLRKDYVSGTQLEIPEDHAFIKLSTETCFTVAVQPGVQVQSLHLAVSMDALEDLLDKSSVKELKDRLASSASLVHNLGRSATSPLRYCLDDGMPMAVRKLRAYARVLDFLGNLTLHFQQSVPRSKHALDAKSVQQYIRQHYRECVTLNDLAKAFGVSTRTINNVLVRETGMPAARLMREQRLALAHEMIQQTDIALSELADRLGYRHLSNFSLAFKKLFGYTPSALRQAEHAYRSPLITSLNLPGSAGGTKD